jgi:hypothetical protein
MATRDVLVFSGRAWPGVKVLAGPGGRLPLVYTANGQGRLWDANRARGFWRSFAEIDLADRSTGVVHAARFIRRHGDPLGRLDAGSASSTEQWLPLASALREIAQAWEPADPDGISIFTVDQNRQELAESALRWLAPPDEGLPEVRLTAQGRRLVPRAATLGGYMAGSAASMLARGVSMRRCEHCADWYEPGRTDARFCCPACQAVHSRQAIAAGVWGRAVLNFKITVSSKDLKAWKAKKGHSHGERTQANPSRPKRLPRRLARKRSRREGPVAK